MTAIERQHDAQALSHPRGHSRSPQRRAQFLLRPHPQAPGVSATSEVFIETAPASPRRRNRGIRSRPGRRTTIAAAMTAPLYKLANEFLAFVHELESRDDLS